MYLHKQREDSCEFAAQTKRSYTYAKTEEEAKQNDKWLDAHAKKILMWVWRAEMYHCTLSEHSGESSSY